MNKDFCAHKSKERIRTNGKIRRTVCGYSDVELCPLYRKWWDSLTNQERLNFEAVNPPKTTISDLT